VQQIGLDADDLIQMAQSPDPEERRQLLAAFPLFVSEYDYQPVDVDSIPYGNFAVRFARSSGIPQVVHNYGAIQSLERLLGLVQERGFILINDYGQTQTSDAGGFEHQRFSGGTFVGINFPLLKDFLTGTRKYQWAEPAAENESIHARLLGHQLAPVTVERFRQLFGKEATEAIQEPVKMARALVANGRFEAALAAYRQALEHQPLNWVLLSEVARFMTFQLANPQAGLALARDALSLNPTCSAEIWNMLGDALFVLGRTDEARFAFERALRISPRDVRAHYNLAFVHQQKRDYDRALEMIARGLALDAGGEFREGLLQKQAEVLGQLANRQHQEAQLLANHTNACPMPSKILSGTPVPQAMAGTSAANANSSVSAPPGAARPAIS
jgi:tetratricopeptide (TPR) repeat protein